MITAKFIGGLYPQDIGELHYTLRLMSDTPVSLEVVLLMDTTVHDPYSVLLPLAISMACIYMVMQDFVESQTLNPYQPHDCSHEASSQKGPAASGVS